MANIKSQIKRNRQNEKRRLNNRAVRGKARAALGKARTAITTGQAEEAQESVLMAISALDKASQKGVLHKNNVARRKSRLMKRLAEMEPVEAKKVEEPKKEIKEEPVAEAKPVKKAAPAKKTTTAKKTTATKKKAE